jgi:hypothetical protein
VRSFIRAVPALGRKDSIQARFKQPMQYNGPPILVENGRLMEA